MRSHRSGHMRRGSLVVAGLTISAGLVAIAAPPAAHAASGFTAGDIVVYRVGDGTKALASGIGAPVFLDAYSPSGSLDESVELPTQDAGTTHALVASGTASSEGELSLSGDGSDLVATGYDAVVGTMNLTSSAAATVPRTVGLVDAAGDVNTTTALTDFSDGNNPRSAVSSNGTDLWVGGAAGGIRYTTVGSTTSTAITNSSDKNVRQVQIVDGQLYTSADPTKASLTVASVGTGLPTSGSITPTNLNFASSSAPSEPYGYAFLTLGTGTTPDTVYVADNTAGAVDKYSLISGTWEPEGSATLAGVTGVTATDVNGVAEIYATTNGSTSGELYSITDSSGAGGTLVAAANPLAESGANEAFRGVAFAPGTTIGSGPGTGGGGGTTTGSTPTISSPQNGLPAAQQDPTNQTLAVNVGDSSGTYTADQLTVTATSSDTDVAPTSGISITGTGASRTLSVTPGSVGYSDLTLTVQAPDGNTASELITYAVSGYQGDPSDRYYSGAGNGSTAVDVGDGYTIVGDDESNVLRMYNTAVSGPPVKTFDFTNVLPYGTTEIDIEASAEVGNTIYWMGSMSNNSSGVVEPARSTLFATTVSGSGANTTLTYVGAYTGIQNDLVSYDENNGSGLGANALGFDKDVNNATANHDITALEVEGIEVDPTNPDTIYLGFRGPLEPVDNPTDALVIPLTNVSEVISGTDAHATFGAPTFWDLGGRGIREIRRDSSGQYFVMAGTADGTNESFTLYLWDGNLADSPVATSTVLPIIPDPLTTGANGSWESIFNLPAVVSNGTDIELMQDDGSVGWYDGQNTSKDGLPADLSKDLGRIFAVDLTQPTSETELSTSDKTPAVGEKVSYTADVDFDSSYQGGVTGTVTFSDSNGVISGCQNLALVSNQATCAQTFTSPVTDKVTATYSGSPTYQTSTSNTQTETVQPYQATITADDQTVALGAAQPTYTYTVSGLQNGDQLTTDPTCTAATYSTAGTYPITCSGASAGSSYQISYEPGTLTVTPAASTVTLTPSTATLYTGVAETVTAKVASAGVTAVPTGTVIFTVTNATTKNSLTCSQGNTVPLNNGQAGCTLPASTLAAGSSYTIAATYSGDSNFNSAGHSLTETVKQGSSKTTLSSSKNPSTSGAAVSFKAKVAAISPAKGTVAGKVTFTIVTAKGKKISCSSGNSKTLKSGVATCSVPKKKLTSATGPYTVSAVYDGSADFTKSTSAKLKQRIKK